MKIFTFIFTFLMTIVATAYVVPTYRDIKPASQVMLEMQAFGAPIAADTDYVKAVFAGATAATAISYSTFTAQPDVPRNLTITPTGTTTDVESCIITVSGTNYLNRAITETFTFAANANTATTGNKAFKTVTSVAFPADCESGAFGATWIIGVGEKIGLKRCMADAGSWFQSSIGGAYESTRATIAASASAVESNTADFNGTMDGAAAFKGYFVQNFACLP